mmetsp:Transcript_48749/g.140195  ORF Transcript_48749/g.140195 Transcript_48749/m.140195 type:complete len:369 (-) Transcript_48749:153-1259(-)
MRNKLRRISSPSTALPEAYTRSQDARTIAFELLFGREPEASRWYRSPSCPSADGCGSGCCCGACLCCATARAASSAGRTALPAPDLAWCPSRSASRSASLAASLGWRSASLSALRSAWRSASRDWRSASRGGRSASRCGRSASFGWRSTSFGSLGWRSASPCQSLGLLMAPTPPAAAGVGKGAGRASAAEDVGESPAEGSAPREARYSRKRFRNFSAWPGGRPKSRKWSSSMSISVSMSSKPLRKSNPAYCASPTSLRNAVTGNMRVPETPSLRRLRCDATCRPARAPREMGDDKAADNTAEPLPFRCAAGGLRGVARVVVLEGETAALRTRPCCGGGDCSCWPGCWTWCRSRLEPRPPPKDAQLRET